MIAPGTFQQLAPSSFLHVFIYFFAPLYPAFGCSGVDELKSDHGKINLNWMKPIPHASEMKYFEVELFSTYFK